MDKYNENLSTNLEVEGSEKGLSFYLSNDYVGFIVHGMLFVEGVFEPEVLKKIFLPLRSIEEYVKDKKVKIDLSSLSSDEEHLLLEVGQMRARYNDICVAKISDEEKRKNLIKVIPEFLRLLNRQDILERPRFKKCFIE